MKYKFFCIFFLINLFNHFNHFYSQDCKILGETEPFSFVVIQGSSLNTISNELGEFELNKLLPGVYNIEISAVGFKKKIIYEVETTISRPAYITANLQPLSFNLNEAEIVTDQNKNPEESPLSVRSIGANEIKRNPGGGRDISKALRSLPGVVSIPSFRNDLVIRGGAPNENRFFIDGIEIPTINHFSTQGSSGGAVGMINVDLVKNVELNTGAFPANRMNALSSVLDFQFIDPRIDEWTSNAVVGTSDLGVTVEGPTGEKSSLVLNARRSYLQFLFKALNLPFLPTYNDMQYKWVNRVSDDTKITLLGIGAIDDFALNTNIEGGNAILDYLEVQRQWNYTQGFRLDQYGDKGIWSFIMSRNHLNNRAFKHIDNDENQDLSKNYVSEEMENKIRIERKQFLPRVKFSSGLNIDISKHSIDNQEFIYNFQSNSLDTIDFNSEIRIPRFGGYTQASTSFLDSRIMISLGFRADLAILSPDSVLPNNTIYSFSPRLSVSYVFAPEWTFNANAGIYNQLPSLTILGYSKENRLGAVYTECKQVVTGVKKEFKKSNTTVSFEGFYKIYDDTPMSINYGVALANLGADFGVVGNEDVSFDGKGVAYGTEFFLQQKLHKGMYGLLSYTWFRSFYEDIVSSWDSQHVVSMTGGKKFNNGFELGARFVFSGGLPYTPYLESSFTVDNWDIFNRPILDYSAINSMRLKAYHQLDVRVDKRFFFKKWTMDIFVEVQNLFGSNIPTIPQFDVERDQNGYPIDSDGDGIYNYEPIENSNSAILPALGLIIEI